MKEVYTQEQKDADIDKVINYYFGEPKKKSFWKWLVSLFK